MKICKDCKHYKKRWFKGAVCTYPDNIEVDLVTGAEEQKTSLVYLRLEMLRGATDACGSDGQWWETRERSKGRLDVILNEEK